tara:strand:- start:933 stop:1289 length:357 start_codon:yes stop_codon:yes gene_type:complete
MNLETFIKENIPDDVIWRNKMVELVTIAYGLGKTKNCTMTKSNWLSNLPLEKKGFRAEPKDSYEFEKRLVELVDDLKDLGSDYMQGMYIDILEDIHNLILNYLDVITQSAIERIGLNS